MGDSRRGRKRKRVKQRKMYNSIKAIFFSKMQKTINDKIDFR